ncbi:MAG: response regulator [Albidovulum sp.]
MKILAVDDDAYIRELLLLIISRSGYEDITVAPSGDAALEAIEVADPAFDCLFFDIQMPGMDGIELCTRVRRIDGYEKTPIIMLTAMTERDFIDRAFAAGATDYVTKPFDTLELGVRARNAEELIKARRAALGGPETERGLLLLEAIKDLVDHQVLRNYLTHCLAQDRTGRNLLRSRSTTSPGSAPKGVWPSYDMRSPTSRKLSLEH